MLKKKVDARIPELDGIRGIAVFLVAISHFQNVLRLPGSLEWKLLQRVLASGWLGVDVFFVLSGFLITRILFDSRTDWKTFYRDRAFRILPAFFLVFFSVLAFAQRPAPWVIFLSLFFLANFTVLGHQGFGPFSHFWSLSVEEQFYLIWPQLVWRSAKPLTILRVALSLAVLSMVLRPLAFALGANAYLLYNLTPTHLDGISIGCAVAAGTQIPAVKEWLTRRWTAIATISAVLLVVGFAALKLSCFPWDARAQMMAIPTVSTLTGALVFAGSERLLPDSLSAMLSNSWLRYLGLRSYALYLIHVPIAYYFDRISPEPHWFFSHTGPVLYSAVMAACGFALSVALAELSWRLVERPAQRLKKRIIQRKKQPATPELHTT